jgi:hypothetical protein
VEVAAEVAAGQQPQQQAAGTAAAAASGGNGGSQNTAVMIPPPPGLQVPARGGSLPPYQRVPGRQRSQDGLQYAAQMVEQMKAMAHELKQVKSQVGKLQQNVNLFSFRPSPVFSDSDDG